ncbi:hypothetical protein LOTGIDRAFT_229773 [Lottia gigantea]|uniref:Uncharacterized protein n=1 Tax=Lottia gigantea TaxID=225164 RepID=V3YXD6_LOTGI|nr:hypothetical protein LOTGIDRAFT_229773 [Lottia gigantea]ESO82738.1 hypothetical protein LOTGIDRAFT_229773 [Lottia gigantea]
MAPSEKTLFIYDTDSLMTRLAISVICPGISKPPVEWIKNIVDDLSYEVKNVPVSMLIEEEFLGAFSRNGKLQVLSTGRFIDTDNCISFLPTGKLILHVNKDTYISLGLEGSKSQYYKNKQTKYVVEVDTNTSSFIPGKNYYERVRTCFRNQPDLVFNLLVNWEPPDENICSTSLKVYFEKKGLEVVCSNLEIVYRQTKNQTIPCIESSQLDTSNNNYEEIFEWLGCVACDIDLQEINSESYLSTLSCPEPNNIINTSCYYQLKGFITSSQIQYLLHIIRKSLEDHPECPWINVTVHGFSDSPVSSSNKEHGYHEGGDYIYSFIIFPNQTYWLYKATDLYDT